ncbi:hypothetical protein BURPS305_6315 [Burkholderia pseudomallei 305]|nr:hypothetical protein BPC006_II2711 [Burkholderia pseudomallei BPC006]EBA50129.1 hypothetical protein BURPS305_6315 [Burkholderia pseudomallei 305]EEP50991.1 hypothetical protein GBP346_B2189 [Burkholderia pseudomallei MSHR346]
MNARRHARVRDARAVLRRPAPARAAEFAARIAWRQPRPSRGRSRHGSLLVTS